MKTATLGVLSLSMFVLSGIVQAQSNYVCIQGTNCCQAYTCYSNPGTCVPPGGGYKNFTKFTSTTDPRWYCAPSGSGCQPATRLCCDSWFYDTSESGGTCFYAICYLTTFMSGSCHPPS